MQLTVYDKSQGNPVVIRESARLIAVAPDMKRFA